MILLRSWMTTYLYHSLIVFLGLHCHRVQALVTMLTQGQMSIYNSGSRIELDCEFLMDDFKMFDNPILWKKSQLDEVVQMNTMRSIHSPFLKTTRITVQMTDASPRYRLLLVVENCTAEDSGNYTCEVRGRKSAVLDQVTHSVAVRAPVRKVYFTSTNLTSDPTTAPDAILRQMIVLEGQGHSLRCVSLGGYPPPSMHIYIGEDDVTDQFRLSSSVTLEGVRGLKLIAYRMEAYTDQLTASTERNGDHIKCFATVPGLWSNVTTITISVNHAPVISCRPASAIVMQRDVRIRCQIRARPDLLALFWIINSNGSTVTQQRGIEDFQSLVTVLRDDLTETELRLNQVLPHHFRRYTVVAENSIDTVTGHVELTRNHSNHGGEYKSNNRNTITDPTDEEFIRRKIHLHGDHHQNPPYEFAPASMTLSTAPSLTSTIPAALTLIAAAAASICFASSLLSAISSDDSDLLLRL